MSEINQAGYSGIAFPFRFNGRGGVAVSTTNVNDFSHINESIYQCIMTHLRERLMLPDFGSECYKVLFSTDDVDANLLAFYVKESIENGDDRVSVDGVEALAKTSDDGLGYFQVRISYTVLKYMKSQIIYINVGI